MTMLSLATSVRFQKRKKKMKTVRLILLVLFCQLMMCDAHCAAADRLNTALKKPKKAKTQAPAISVSETISASDQRPPNVVFVFIDDMGYGDIEPFGSTRNKTPNLNRMAAQGMKLTDFYVSSTACSPSRAALMTGC